MKKIEVSEMIEGYVELDGLSLSEIIEKFAYIIHMNKKYLRITLEEEREYFGDSSPGHWDIKGWRLETDEEFEKRKIEVESWKQVQEAEQYKKFLELKEKFEK